MTIVEGWLFAWITIGDSTTFGNNAISVVYKYFGATLWKFAIGCEDANS